MGYIIVLRPFEKDDEKECNALLQEAVKSLTNNMIKDTIFMKLLYLFVLYTILLNFGVSQKAISLLVIVYAMFVYIMTYLSVTKRIVGLKRNIWRDCLYKSNCSIWVAEALEPLHIKRDIKNEPYIIIPDYEYRRFEMSFRFISSKIVGIISVCGSSKDIYTKANIDMLFVHNLYAERNIEEKLLEIATTYAINKKCFGINIQLTEYHRKIMQMCLQCGFKLMRTYSQFFFLKTLTMYELTYQMPEDNVDR
ncbi:uncharacterized protein LOC116852765 [Odontomachus brunneus]|uniref:uncharacterized protein LOC116852765 n=1 Tax=Odontomachus brunneus TaxID=486640 RepID=UPI0013F1A794|nr:uncharacterized protein LOC116852765 [Odontomachus brunneus]